MGDKPREKDWKSATSVREERTECSQGDIIHDAKTTTLEKSTTQVVSSLCQSKQKLEENHKRKIETGGSEAEYLDLMISQAGEMFVEGNTAQALVWYETAINHARRTEDRRREAVACIGIAGVYKVLAEYDKSTEYCDRCIAIAKGTKSKICEYLALSVMGNVEGARGNYKGALEKIEQSLSIARKARNNTLICDSLIQVAKVCTNLGMLSKSANYCEEALRIVENTGDEKAIGELCLITGYAYCLRGDPTKAIESIEKALNILDITRSRTGASVATEEAEGSSTSHGDDAVEKVTKRNAYYTIAGCYSTKGDYEKAVEYFTRCLGIAKEIEQHGHCYKENLTGSGASGVLGLQGRLCQPRFSLLPKHVNEKRIELNLLQAMGKCFEKEGRYTRALECFSKCETVAKLMKDDESEAEACLRMGEIYVLSNNFSQAIDYFEKGLALNKSMRTKTKVVLYLALGFCHCSQGNYEKAMQYCEKCLPIAIEIQDIDTEQQLHVCMGNIQILRQGEVLKEWETPLKNYQRALELARENGYKIKEASTCAKMSQLLCVTSQYDSAIELAKITRNLASQLGDKNMEAKVLVILGDSYKGMRQYKYALDAYEQSVRIARSLKDQSIMVSALCSVATTHSNLGEFSKAIEVCQECLSCSRDQGTEDIEEIVHQATGEVYLRQGNCIKSAEHLLASLSAASVTDHKRTEANVCISLAKCYCMMGQHSKVVTSCRRAMDIATELGWKDTENTVLGILSDVYRTQRDYSKAKECKERSTNSTEEIGDDTEQKGFLDLTHGGYLSNVELQMENLQIARDLGDRHSEGITLTTIARSLRIAGEYAKAMEYCEESISVSRDIGSKTDEGHAYLVLGDIYFCQGEHFKAIECYSKSLVCIEETGHYSTKVVLYDKLGSVYIELGQTSMAKEYTDKGLAIARQQGDKESEGELYMGLGSVCLQDNDYEKAIEYYRRALGCSKESGNRSKEGCAYINLGYSFGFQGRWKGLELNKKALEIMKSIGTKMGEMEALFSIGFQYCIFRKSFKDAVPYLEDAVRLYEGLRTSIGKKDHSKIAFAEMNCKSYQLLVESLLRDDRIVDAAVAAEHARARALADSLCFRLNIDHEGSPQGYAADILGSEDIRQIVKAMKRTVISYSVGFMSEVFRWVYRTGRELRYLGSPPLGDSDGRFTDPLESTVSDLMHEIKRRGKSFQCENRHFSSTATGKPKSSRELDGSHTLLAALAYKNTHGHSVEVARNIFIEDSHGVGDSVLRRLYDILVGPAEGALEGNELLIIPERHLYNVPFAALEDKDGRFLCEKFRTRLIPSFTIMKMILESPEGYHCQTGALIVGDPHVGTIYYGGREIYISRLEFARQEAEKIGALLGVQPLIGDTATKDEVLKRLASVSLVHIAAHGNPEAGEIVLAPAPEKRRDVMAAEDVLLTMADVQQRKLRAKLVVLSCCHSGRGEVRAEGVIGIARAFLASGARSVLASLWAVDDKATMEFMCNFYQHLKRGETASSALHLTIAWMREKEYDVWRWAPFVLIGDDVKLEHI